MLEKLNLRDFTIKNKNDFETIKTDYPKAEILPFYENPIKEKNMPKIDANSIFGKIAPNFDIDGDGKLSEKEKAAAVAYHEKQAAEKVKNQFDLNKDGKLDEAEQAAYEAYVGGKETKQASSIKPQQVTITPETPASDKTEKDTESAIPEFKAKEVKKEQPENQMVKKAEKNVELYKKMIEKEKQLLANLEKQLDNTPIIKVGKRKQLKEEIAQTKRNIEIFEGYLESAERELAKLKGESVAQSNTQKTSFGQKKTSEKIKDGVETIVGTYLAASGVATATLVGGPFLGYIVGKKIIE